MSGAHSLGLLAIVGETDGFDSFDARLRSRESLVQRCVGEFDHRSRLGEFLAAFGLMSIDLLIEQREDFQNAVELPIGRFRENIHVPLEILVHSRRL